jgi:diguanylate cyclase (GGDEF)-like protein/PAS domain S-box-containing protein
MRRGVDGENDILDPAGGEAALRRPSGEFRDAALERLFRAGHAVEDFRHARVLLIASAILNTVFLSSDWRFYGSDHFLVAIPARLLVIAAALTALLHLYRDRSPPGLNRAMGGWMIVNGIGVATLVSSHSDIAMFVMIMLPIIYYLAVPVPFRLRIAGGTGCSLGMIIGYESGYGEQAMSYGLALSMLILNVAMVLVVARSNRLERLEWRAARRERQIAAELAASREQIEKMFGASPVPMIVSARDDGRLVRINDAAAQMLRGESGNIADCYADPEDRRRILQRLDESGEVRNFEMQVRLRDQSRRTVLVNASLLDLTAGRLIISGIIDISDRKAAEQDLEWLASTDPLTSLANRLSFFAAGRAEMMRAARTGAPLALMMADLDHFKEVNDNFGHQGGDEALRSFAAVCRGAIGDEGVIGRLGGEEFGILLRNSDIDRATMLAERLRDATAGMTVEAKRGQVRLTASIGVAMVDAHDLDLDASLARADGALYAAKNAGRNCVVAEDPVPARRVG